MYIELKKNKNKIALVTHDFHEKIILDEARDSFGCF